MPSLPCDGVQAPLPGARNHFPAEPFLYGGIGCQSCHGDPAVHLASAGKAPILNPDKLPASKRDSICLQCHLEGEIAVNVKGLSLAAFHPGEDLSAYVTHFVHAGELRPNGRATSQWEALLQSECKKKVGIGLPARLVMIRTARPRPRNESATIAVAVSPVMAPHRS